MSKKSMVISTGFFALDNALNGGLCPGSFTIVAGRPGMGKTSFLKQIAKATEFGCVLFLDNENAVQALTGEEWKELAQKLQIPILATVKVSRDCEKRENRRPRFSDLCPGRADLPAAADTAIALYRDHYYHCTDSENVTGGELLILKNKWNEPCEISMTFDSSTRLWSDDSLKKT